MKKITPILIMSILCLFAFQTHAQLTVTGGVSGSDLANILAGDGVSISNVVLNCPNNASGSFANGNTTNIGLDQGVLMTTGAITQAPGPNSSPSSSIDNGGGGDADLTAASGFTTFNACVLEFDFVPAANQLTLEYVFASEEYNEYVCSQFNDVFGFFVSGPKPGGGNYVNQDIALVPGKNIPVTINNINNGSPGTFSTGNCGDMTNTALYTDNSPGATIEYDGFTVTLQATLELLPCATYHFKFAIADASDPILDAGVFLKEASFQTNNIVAVATDSPEGCPGGEITFTSTLTNYTGYTIDINVLPSSTASASDYKAFALNYNLPAGQQTLTVPIESIADILDEGSETIDFEFAYDAGCDPQLDASSIFIIDGPITCKDFVLILDGDGYGSISPEDVLTGDLGADCPSFNFSLSKEDFVCSDEGDNLVTITATTADGDVSECTSTVTVVVPPDIITVDLGDECRVVYYGYDPLSCTEITAEASGGTPPYSYAWSNGEMTKTINVCPIVTTFYDVTVTDINGCVQASGTAEVEVIDVHCGNNGNKVLVCHVPPGNPGNEHNICVSANAVPAHLAHGDYLGQCGDVPCDDVVPGFQEGSSVELRESNEVIPVLYPNPTSNSISLQDYLEFEFTSLQVLNVQGQVVGTLTKKELLSSRGDIHFVDQIAEGTYLIKFENEGAFIHLMRFVKIR